MMESTLRIIPGAYENSLLFRVFRDLPEDEYPASYIINEARRTSTAG